MAPPRRRSNLGRRTRAATRARRFQASRTIEQREARNKLQRALNQQRRAQNKIQRALNQQRRSLAFDSHLAGFRFPKHEEVRQQWLEAVNRTNWSPINSSKICSLHFKDADIDRTSLSCVRIREGAVPSIFNDSCRRKNIGQITFQHGNEESKCKTVGIFKRKRGRPRKKEFKKVQFKPEMWGEGMDKVEDADEGPVTKRSRGRPRKRVVEDTSDKYLVKREVVSCCALACTNTSETSSVYPLPKDEALRQTWLDNIDQLDWTPEEDSAVCDIHFADEMWVDGYEKKLKPEAVPTLFMHGEAIKSWVTMDNSGNFISENNEEDNLGGEDHDDMSEDNDAELCVKREALEPEIDMVEGSEDVLSREPDNAEEEFETIFCDTTYNDQDCEVVGESGNPFDQDSNNSIVSSSSACNSDRPLIIQEDDVSSANHGQDKNTSKFLVISQPGQFIKEKMIIHEKARKRRQSDQLPNEFQCKFCKKKLSRRKNLEIHMQKLHPHQGSERSQDESKNQDGKENHNILKNCLKGKKPPALAPLLPQCLLASPPPMSLPTISTLATPTLMATPIVTSTMVAAPNNKDASPPGGEMKKQFLLLLPQPPPPPPVIPPRPVESPLKPNTTEFAINLTDVPSDKRQALKAKIKELVEAVSTKNLDPNRIIIAYDRT